MNLLSTAIFHEVSVDSYFEENILLEPGEGEVDKERLSSQSI